MRARPDRGLLPAVAAATGAAGAHVLDAGGLLPGVHETEAVRTAMGPLATLAWLALAAALGAVAARTRPVLAGAPAALVVSGIPELVGRHDPGAVGEPGAVAGALLQWLLLLVAVALAVAAERRLLLPPSPRLPDCSTAPPPARPAGHPAGPAPSCGRPRAPPTESSHPSTQPERTSMSAPTPRARTRVVAAALLAPLLVALAACGGSSSGGEDEDEGEVATGPCPSSISQTASTQPPSDLPTPDGADSAYDYFAQGATKVWYFALDGDAGELASLRDGYDDTLTAKGYEIEDTDQEAGHEAESEFKGPHEGTTNFRTLCDGKVVLRLKVTS